MIKETRAESHGSAPLSSRVGVILAAAGSSQRMGGQDKIFVSLLGKPLIAYAIEVFQEYALVDQIVLVLSEKNLTQGQGLVREQRWQKVTDVCLGGLRRQDSVAEGLKRLRDCHWVIIHDGARPCLTADLVQRGMEEAQHTGAAIAAVPVKDTIKVVGDGGIARNTPERSSLWAAQTPQVFRCDIIREAYRQAKGEVSDDAALVERLGYQVKVYLGSPDNIKVTTEVDLRLAEAILRNRNACWHRL